MNAHERPGLLEEEEVPGLAGERTDLAWTRSGIAGLAAIGAILKLVIDGLDLESASEIVVAVLVAVALAWGASIVYVHVFAETTRHPDRAVDPQRMRRVATATALFGVAALGLAFVG